MRWLSAFFALLAASTAVTAPAPPPRSPFAFANVDPDDDLVVAPPAARTDCHEALAAAGIDFVDARLPVHTETFPPHAKKGHARKLTCGADQVVVYRGSPAHIRWPSPPILTCTMALALARFETLAQEEAKEHLGQPIVAIQHLGTYSCRDMAAYPGWVSEHSYANAIDVASFTLKNGREVSVLKHFQKGEKTSTREAAFLRVLSHRAFDEEVFSTVLTGFFDRAHDNHFHLDLARYLTDGTRPTP